MNSLEKQKKIESKYRDILLGNPTTYDFSEAYDEINAFFKQDRNEMIYPVNMSPPGILISEKYQPGIKILEIGTGNGSTAIALAKKGFHVTTIDISKVALDVTRHRVGSLELPLKIEYCDARSLDFEENAFDVAISSCLVEHLNDEDVEIHLKNVKWVLKPSGCYYFYAGNRLISGYKSAGLHLKMYSTKEQLDLAASLGFDPKYVPMHFHKLFPKVEIDSNSILIRIIFVYEKIFEFLSLHKLLNENLKIKYFLVSFGTVCAYNRK